MPQELTLDEIKLKHKPRELSLEEIFDSQKTSPPHPEIDSSGGSRSFDLKLMKVPGVGFPVPYPAPVGEGTGLENTVGQFAFGVTKGATAGIVGDMIGKDIYSQYQPSGFVEEFARTAGEFTGFIGGVPMKVGTGSVKLLGKTGAGKQFFKWFGDKVGPRAVNWLREGLGLGIATAVSNSQETMSLLEHPSLSNLGNELTSRADGLWRGAATGARFGIIRDTIGKFGLRAAMNLAISNGVLAYRQVVNKDEDIQWSNVIFNSFLDVYFSIKGSAPSKFEQERMRELSDMTLEVLDKDGRRPGDIVRSVMEEVEQKRTPLEIPEDVMNKFRRKNLKVAIKMGEDVITREEAQVHADLLDMKEMREMTIAQLNEMEQGFVDPMGKFLSRKEAADLVGVTRELDSFDIIKDPRLGIRAEDMNSVIEEISVDKTGQKAIDLIARKEWDAIKVVEEIDARIGVLKGKDILTEAEQDNFQKLTNAKMMLTQPMSTAPEYKEIRNKMLVRREEIKGDPNLEILEGSAERLAEVRRPKPKVYTGDEVKQAGLGLINRQKMIDALSTDFSGGEKSMERLLQLRKDQRDAVELFSIMTNRRWEYDPGTKKWNVGGVLDPTIVRPETVEGSIRPDEPSYIYERVKAAAQAQLPDPGMEEIYQGLGGDVMFKTNPGRIAFGADVLWGPEFALRKYPEAARISGKIVESQHFLDYTVRKDNELFDRWNRHLPGWFGRKFESEQVRSAIEDIYTLRNVETKLQDIVNLDDLPVDLGLKVGDLKAVRDRVNDARQKHPERYEVAEAIVKWFGDVRELVKTHKREMIRGQRPQEWFEAFNRSITESFDQDGKLLPVDVRKKNWEEITKRYGIEGKKNIDKFTDMVRDYLAVDFWGVEDYITRIERGTWKVFDENDHVRAVKLTGREAQEEAQLLIDTKQIKKATIANEYSKLDPLTKRKNVLKGEQNIFDALKSYAWAVRKRMIIEPLQLEMEQEFANNPDKYTPEMKAILNRQMEAMRGVYSWEDRFVDALFERAGSRGRPFRATRAVGRVRQVEGMLKLGYRPVASAVNLLFGHAHTITKVGAIQWGSALRWMRTPEGKAWLKSEEPYMGITFTEFEGAGREVKSILNPLWLFSRPERGIRRTSLAANYLYAKNKQGMTDKAAREFAQRSMRVQSFVYNTTALPVWMRTPAGKLVGQFKSYIVQEMQFLNTLSGKEWTRYLAMTAMLGGPQAVMHILQSLPFLDNMGVLEKIEEWMLNQRISKDVPLIGGKRWMFGIPGLLGTDISISAAVQLPNTLDEWAGPAISDMIKLGKMAYDAQNIGAGEAFGVEDFKQSSTALGKTQAVVDKLGQFAVQMNYMNDILTTQYKFMPDGRIWARDRKQNLTYPIDSTIDYVKLLMGAKPMNKAVYQNKLRIVNKEKQRRVERARDVVRRGIRLFNSELRLPPNFEDDLIRVGIWDSNSFVQALTNRQLTPEQRSVMGEAKVDQLRALDIFYEELYRDLGKDFE